MAEFKIQWAKKTVKSPTNPHVAFEFCWPQIVDSQEQLVAEIHHSWQASGGWQSPGGMNRTAQIICDALNREWKG